MIPLKIYRTWKNVYLPENYQKAWNYTQINNPQFAQVLYTDDHIYHFLNKHYKNHSFWKSDVYDAYYKINPNYHAARADLFRYALIYEKGGVYMDIKSAANNITELVRNKNTLLYSPWEITSLFRFFSMFSLNLRYGEFQQWWFAAPPKNNILKNVITEVVKNINTYKYNGSYEKCQAMRKRLGNGIFSYLLFLDSDCISYDTFVITGPYVFTRTIMNAHRSYPLNANGNNKFIYDFTGDHRMDASYLKDAYWNKGSPLVL